MDKDYSKIITTLRYDLIGKLVGETKLTRKAIVDIIKGIEPNIFYLFSKNSEEFIQNTSKIINQEKA